MGGSSTLPGSGSPLTTFNAATCYSGTVTGVPAITLNPTSLTFAATTIGNSSTAMVSTLTNSGTATLNITSIALGGVNPSQYSETTTCGASVAVSATCTISVIFTPTATGVQAASVIITSNITAGTTTLPLSGTGAAVVINPVATPVTPQLLSSASDFPFFSTDGNYAPANTYLLTNPIFSGPSMLLWWGCTRTSCTTTGNIDSGTTAPSISFTKIDTQLNVNVVPTKGKFNLIVQPALLGVSGQANAATPSYIYPQSYADSVALSYASGNQYLTSWYVQPTSGVFWQNIAVTAPGSTTTTSTADGLSTNGAIQVTVGSISGMTVNSMVLIYRKDKNQFQGRELPV